MLKALIKKQIAELFASMFRRGKNKSKRSSAALYILLFAFIFGWFGFMIFTGARAFGESIIDMGYDWLYFAIFGTFSVAFGVLGSVFSAYTALYNAKDNEALLAMPIRPWKILFARMITVYVMGLIYSSLVFVPSVAAYFVVKTPSVITVLSCVLLLFLLGIITLVLTCVLGFFVALVASRLKRKSILTVIIALAFLALYYLFYFRLQSIIQNITENIVSVAQTLKNSFYPLYVLGNSAVGDPLSLAIVAAFCLLITALTAFVLSRTFTKIVTTNKGEKQAIYKEKAAKAHNAGSALLRREIKRFVSSPAYMLNSGFGLLMLPIAAVAIIFYAPTLKASLANMSQSAVEDLVPILAAAAVMLLSSMSTLTAPSISLEAKTLWLVRSLPVKTKDVIDAKRNMHVLLVLVPALVTTFVASVAIGVGVANALATALLIVSSVFFTANLGLVLNLKHPNLTWVNEYIPIKQGLPVFVMTFYGMLSPIFAIAIYFLINLFVPFPTWIYLIALSVINGAGAVLTDRWLAKKGVEKFEEL